MRKTNINKKRYRKKGGAAVIFLSRNRVELNIRIITLVKFCRSSLPVIINELTA
jgi:hypothetical protein